MLGSHDLEIGHGQPERFEHRRRNLRGLYCILNPDRLYALTPEDDWHVPVLASVATVRRDFLDLGRTGIHGTTLRNTDDIRYARVLYLGSR